MANRHPAIGSPRAPIDPTAAQVENMSAPAPTLQPNRQSQSDRALKARLDALENLRAVEKGFREANTEAELAHLVANQTRKLVGARQVVVFRQTGRKFFVVAVSSVAVVDRATPFIRWMETTARRARASFASNSTTAFEASAFQGGHQTTAQSYPFPYLIWSPIVDRKGDSFAGVLCARETPWTADDSRFIDAHKDVIAVHWRALGGRASRRSRRWLRGTLKALAVTLLCGAMALPVPMTTLAPFEVVAHAPQHVTAPLNAVIKTVLVRPNQPVVRGQPLLQFDDTILRNELRVAEQAVTVAAARYDLAQQNAFRDPSARRDVSIAKAELDLKSAERDFAQEKLAKTTVYAARDGIAIYSDEDTLIGRPVKVGERLLDIADPDAVALRVEVPIADAIVIDKSQRVRLFLNSEPLSSLEGRITAIGYHAEPNSTQQLVYPVKAKFDRTNQVARIGDRGTAQLFGETVPLAFFLLRRPFTSLRQYFGF